MKKFFFLFLVIPFLSCQNGPKLFADKEMRILQFDAVYELAGDVFLEEEYGILNLIAVDDYLVLVSVKRDHVFFLYGTDGVKRGSFGTIGRGPDEVLNARYTGQIENEGTGSKIWINDVSNATLKRIHLDSSLQAGRIVSDREIASFPGAANSYYGNDSLLYIERMLDTNYEMVRYNYLTDKTVDSQTLYRQWVMNPFSLYKSIWRKHPSQPLMVNAMHSLNRINLLNLSDKKRTGIVIGQDRMTPENGLDEQSGLEKHTYYCDLVVTEELIYALWMDQPYEEAYETPKSQAIHVFDWQGNPKACLNVPEYICQFTIDPAGQTMYGMTPDEVIYRYDLPEIR
jgi:hypothetical protein